MRDKPTWRIPVGILALLALLAVYALVVAAVANWIGQMPALLQAPVYLVLGLAWLLPLRRYLIWMETGRWG